MSAIKLKSSDGEVFSVDEEILKHTMLEDFGMDEDDEEILLPNINAAILEKVIQWATYHKDDPPPSEDEDDEIMVKRTDDICSWDTDFLHIADVGTVCELIMAANYLNIKGCWTSPPRPLLI